MLEARSDVVGSLLRPPALRQAQELLDRGEISPPEFKRTEDDAVEEALRIQHEAGVAVVTDGELRRLASESQFPSAVEGLGLWDVDAFLWGDWRSEAVGDLRVRRPELGVVARLRRRRSMCAEEFTFVRSRTDRVAKVTLPSPSLFASFWDPDHPTRAYRGIDDFLGDVAELLREEVEELVELGCTYIQLDAPHYLLLSDPAYRSFYESRGWPAERWVELGIELDNHVIGDHPGVTFGFHLCRGNQGSRWLVSGGYDAVADRIFPVVRAERLLLEYDDARSGGFEPLAKVPDDTVVVLGLVSSKTPRLETVDEIVARVRAASAFVPLERLAVSTQCGFATSVVGNAITPEDQLAKLRLVAAVAGAVWG